MKSTAKRCSFLTLNKVIGFKVWDTIGQGIIEAIRLIFAADPEIFEIVGLSLYVSFTSVIISTVVGIPLGILIGTYDFKGKGIIVRLIYTFMSLPPVIAGLTVFLILMRRGPLGSLQLNYTVPAMIIAQICLVTPIIVGLTYNIVKEKAPVVNSLGITLGVGRTGRMKLLIYEMRVGINDSRHKRNSEERYPKSEPL